MNCKRLLAILLAVMVMVLPFAACGGQKQASDSQQSAAVSTEENKGETSKPAEKKTIVIYAADEIKEKDAPAFYKEFEEQNNAIVKPIIQPSDKYVQTFMVAANSGQQIDVLLLNGQDVRAFSKKGLIQDLGDAVTYWDRFIESAVSQYTFGGKKYAVPIAPGNTSGIYYNKEIFQKHNLQPPKSLAELINVNKELNKNGIAGFGFGGANIYMWPMWYFSAFAQTSGNKSIERTIEALEGKAKFTDPDFVEAMKVLETFGKESMFQKGFNGADSAAGQATFVSGKAGMYFGGTWEVDGFRKGGLKEEQLGIVPFPVVKDGVKSEQTGSAAGAAIALYSKVPEDNKALSLALIDYVSSDKKNLEKLKLYNTVITCNKNVRVEGGDPIFEDIQKELTPTTVTFLDWIWPPEITKEYQVAIQAVAGGKITAEAAMEKIQKVYDDIKAKGYDFNATQ